MKILTTAFILIIALILLPLSIWYWGEPLHDKEWEILNLLIIISLSVSILTFIVGELTGNNSQVDKIWGLLPSVYLWTVTVYSHFDPRLLIMSILVTVWGIRLTYNFSRRGAFVWPPWLGEEDYRWEILRNKPQFKPKWKWTLFNLFFISLYQNSLILLFTLPSIVVLQNSGTELNFIDVIAISLMLFFIVFETIADQQQWKYQSAKHGKIKNGEVLTGDFAKGFLDKGLWSLSRHPNYFAEQSIWVSYYLFSVASSGQWLNWSVIGCILLILLFQGSSNFSEEISSSKYPDYKKYQKKVRRFIPIPK